MLAGWQFCRQRSNYMDFEFAPIFKRHKLQLRNRIIWTFGHGLHTGALVSGRYEVILWYTKTDVTTSTSIQSEFLPSTRPSAISRVREGQAFRKSSRQKSRRTLETYRMSSQTTLRKQSTLYPKFPVGLIERLVLSGGREVVFDPFTGVASAGVASLVHGRRFIGVRTGLHLCQDWT